MYRCGAGCSIIVNTFSMGSKTIYILIQIQIVTTDINYVLVITKLGSDKIC